jgi:hypothetical protein
MYHPSDVLPGRSPAALGISPSSEEDSCPSRRACK